MAALLLGVALLAALQRLPLVVLLTVLLERLKGCCYWWW